MNEAHEHCGSDEWRQAIREVILPWALGETDVGYGATTDVLGESVPRLASVEVVRVLRPSDSVASDELEAHHEGDTYNPVDPSTSESRVAAAGFTDFGAQTAR